MPHKFNAARRHKFDKVQYRVINWAEYNESLRQRVDLTIWVSEEAQSVWSAPRRTSRGGQRRYSDLAIETCLMLRTVISTPSLSLASATSRHSSALTSERRNSPMNNNPAITASVRR